MRVYEFTTITVENDEGDRLVFEYNGSLTVQVYQVDECVRPFLGDTATGDFHVVIDAFMFTEPPTQEYLRERCVEWATEHWE